MDWLAAVSSWIHSLAWPVVVLVLGLVFRHQVRAALGKLRHLEAPGVKADFGDELAEAEVAAVTLTGNMPDEAKPADAPAEQTSSSVPPPSTPLSYGSGLTDPSGSILRAWQRLYEGVVEYAHATDVVPRSRKNPNRGVSVLVRELRNRGFLEDDAAGLIMELSDLRNRVAHGRHVPTPGEAITYHATADSAIRFVRQSQEQVTNRDGASNKSAGMTR